MQTLDFGEYCQMKRFLGLPVNPNPVAEFDAYILNCFSYTTFRDMTTRRNLGDPIYF